MPNSNSILCLNLPADMVGESAVAVAVSGGADSMALAFLLSRWAVEHGVELHVLSVDHGFRAAAKDEVLQVAEVVSGWKNVTHHILTYTGALPESAIQEEARNLRYRLMAERCAELGVRYLCLAHHRDDQGETVLFRLAKGSGLDGLCAMRAVSAYSDDLDLVRPLLEVSKAELLAFCVREGISYIDDPSNENMDFARVRLRAAREVLEAEGLSNKRLALSAKRLQRARDALEAAAEVLYLRAVSLEGNVVNLDVSALRAAPEEIAFRVILQVVKRLRVGADYNPRLERLEALFQDFWDGGVFRKRTLGGLVFSICTDGGVLRICLEAG